MKRQTILHKSNFKNRAWKFSHENVHTESHKSAASFFLCKQGVSQACVKSIRLVCTDKLNVASVGSASPLVIFNPQGGRRRFDLGGLKNSNPKLLV